MILWAPEEGSGVWVEQVSVGWNTKLTGMGISHSVKGTIVDTHTGTHTRLLV